MILFITILGQKGEIDNRGFYPAGEGDGNYCFRPAKGQQFHEDIASNPVSRKTPSSQLFTSFYPELTPAVGGLTMVFQDRTDFKTQ
jgi:hypothetical protein